MIAQIPFINIMQTDATNIQCENKNMLHNIPLKSSVQFAIF